MSGNRVTIDGDHLVVEPLGLDRAWSFARRLRVPLDEVVHAFFDPSVIPEPGRLRAPGLRLPWKVAGTFHAGGRRQFWNTSTRRQAIVVALSASARFDRLILSVDDPLRTVDMINEARP